MGKTRKNYPDTYVIPKRSVSRGQFNEIVIPTDGHSPEWMKQFVNNLLLWTNGGFFDLNKLFTPSQKEYIKKHMELFNFDGRKPLNRVERLNHFKKLGLKEGDTINLNELRSFIDDEEMGDFMKMIGDYSDGALIYTFKDAVPGFNISKFNQHENEFLVNMSNMKIKKIVEIKDKDSTTRNEKYWNITGDHFERDEDVPKTITLVELEYAGDKDSFPVHEEEPLPDSSIFSL